MAATELRTTQNLVSLEEIRAAARVLDGVARRTPLLMAHGVRESRRAELRLKCEQLQLGGAFKFRGAYNFIAGLADDVRASGVVTYSSGNHGRAVAQAARILGIPAVVVVPVDAPDVKVDGVLGQGAEVVREGTTSLERRARAEAIAEERRLPIVPPFDDRRIIAGQGTVGLEIVEDRPAVERVVVPVGGGGLLAGVAAAVKALAPRARVYGVEPRGAAAMHRSLASGELETLEATDTVADGLKPVRPGELTFAHARSLVEEIVLVSDDEILDAMVWLGREMRMMVEPSGAAAVGAVLAGRVPEPDVATVAVISGGNVDPMTWARWMVDRSARTETA